MDSYNLINGEHFYPERLFQYRCGQKAVGFQGVMIVGLGCHLRRRGRGQWRPRSRNAERQVHDKENLLPAIRDGRVKESVIDEKSATS